MEQTEEPKIVQGPADLYKRGQEWVRVETGEYFTHLREMQDKHFAGDPVNMAMNLNTDLSGVQQWIQGTRDLMDVVEKQLQQASHWSRVQESPENQDIRDQARGAMRDKVRDFIAQLHVQTLQVGRELAELNAKQQAAMADPALQAFVAQNFESVFIETALDELNHLSELIRGMGSKPASLKE